MPNDTERDQWGKINQTIKALSDHEKECEGRHARIEARLVSIENRLDSMRKWFMGLICAVVAGGLGVVAAMYQ